MNLFEYLLEIFSKISVRISSLFWIIKTKRYKSSFNSLSISLLLNKTSEILSKIFTFKKS